MAFQDRADESLGVGSSCVWTSRTTVAIVFGSNPGVLPLASALAEPSPLNSIYLCPDNNVRHYYATDAGDFVTAQQEAASPQFVGVGLPAAPVVPTVIVSSPNMVGICDAAVVDASQSTGSAGRGLYFTWRRGNPFTNADLFEQKEYIARLDEVLANASASAANEFGSPKITLLYNHLAPGFWFQVKVFVRNFFGEIASSSVTIAKASLPVPLANIQGDSWMTTTRSLGLGLAVDAAMPELSCTALNASDSVLYFRWSNPRVLDGFGNDVTSAANVSTHTDGPDDVVEPLFGGLEPANGVGQYRGFKVSNGGSRLTIHQGVLRPYHTYSIRVELAMGTNNRTAEYPLGVPDWENGNADTVVVYVKEQDLVAMIDGGDRLVGTRYDLSVFAGNSEDPDQVSESTMCEGCKYRWDLFYSPSEARESRALVADFGTFARSRTSSKLQISSSNLADLVAEYKPAGEASAYFTAAVTVSKTGNGAQALRNASTTVSISVQSGNPPLVSIDSTAIPRKLSRQDGFLKLNGEVEWQVAGNINNPAGPVSCPNTRLKCLHWELVVSDVGTDKAFGLPIKENSAATTTGYFYYDMVVNLAALTPGSSYTFRLVAAEAGSTGFSSATITMNRAPRSGVALSVPDAGEALLTPFELTTSGWIDDVDDYPLSFRFGFYSGFIASVEDVDESPVCDFQASPTKADVYLPVGANANFTITVVAYAEDVFEASSIAKVEVIVTEPQIELEELGNAAESLVGDKLASGDSAAALSVISAVGSTLNTVVRSGGNASDPAVNATDDSEAEAASASLRESMLNVVLDAVDTMDMSNPADVTAVLAAGSSMSSNPEQLTTEAQKSSMDLMLKATEGAESSGSISPETAMLVVGSLSNLLQTSLFDAPEDTDDGGSSDGGNATSPSDDAEGDDGGEDADASLEAAQSLFAITANLAASLLSSQFPGMDPVVVETASLQLAAQILEASDLSGASTSAGANSFDLGDAFGEDIGASGNVDLQTQSLLKNPFQGASSTNVISQVASFTAKDGGAARRRLRSRRARGAASGPGRRRHRHLLVAQPQDTIATSAAASGAALYPSTTAIYESRSSSSTRKRRRRRMDEANDDGASDVIKVVNTTLDFTIAGQFPVYDASDVILNGTCHPRCSDCALLFAAGTPEYNDCLQPNKKCIEADPEDPEWYMNANLTQRIVFRCPMGDIEQECGALWLNWTDGTTTRRGPPYSFTFECPISVPQCQWFDLENRRWSEEGCEVLNYTETEIYCRCNHATDFGSSVEDVAGTASASFNQMGELSVEDILKVLVILITLITADLLFLLVAIYARYLDKRDKARLSLDDNSLSNHNSRGAKTTGDAMNDFRNTVRPAEPITLVAVKSWWQALKSEHRVTTIVFEFDKDLTRTDRLLLLLLYISVNLVANALAYPMANIDASEVSVVELIQIKIAVATIVATCNAVVASFTSFLFNRTKQKPMLAEALVNLKDEDLSETIKGEVDVRRRVQVAEHQLIDARESLAKIREDLGKRLAEEMLIVELQEERALTPAEKLSFQEQFESAMQAGDKAVYKAKEALRRAQQVERFTARAENQRLDNECKELTKDLKGLGGLVRKFMKRREMKREATLGKLSHGELLVFRAEQEEIQRLDRFTRAVYKFALSPSEKFLRKQNRPKPFPKWTKWLLYVVSVAAIVGCQLYTLSFSVVLNNCASCSWDGDAETCNAKDGSPDEWCDASCNVALCGTGQSLAMLWLQTVLIALALTLLVSQPMSVLMSKGCAPLVARILLNRTGDFAGRVQQRVEDAEHSAAQHEAAEVREEDKKRRRRDKETQKRKERKAERERKRNAHRNKGAIAPELEPDKEDLQVDEVGAREFNEYQQKQKGTGARVQGRHGKIAPEIEADLSGRRDEKPSPRLQRSAPVAPSAEPTADGGNQGAEEPPQVMDQVAPARTPARELTAPPTEEVSAKTKISSTVEQRALDVRAQRTAMDDLRQQKSIGELKKRLLNTAQDKPLPAPTTSSRGKSAKMAVVPSATTPRGPTGGGGGPQAARSPTDIPKLKNMPQPASGNVSASAAAAAPAAAPAQTQNELWTCPASGATMKLSQRADFLLASPEYRECWQRILAALVEQLGKEETEARVSLVYKDRRCGAEEAFCALAECGGDVGTARSKLKNPAYLEEMKLASEACRLKQYVSTKKKRRKKKKKKNKEEEDEGGGAHSKQHTAPAHNAGGAAEGRRPGRKV